MNVAVADRDVFENFEPATDAFFFKLGSNGLVSFHGRNYTIKKKLSAEEQSMLIMQPQFVRVGHQCYANKDKITALENQMLWFDDKESYPKTLSVAPWLQWYVKKQLSY
jgi:hypothetical protein